MYLQRLAENPIVRPEMAACIGTNINGPSLIRVPAWVRAPLGRYYLYFAHHNGDCIRLAYADALRGPWRIHEPGTLRLGQTCCRKHIASPDVHVDPERKKIKMYFHGATSNGQRSFLAESDDGLAFVADTVDLGPYYFRVFRHEGWHYAIARAEGKQGGCLLMRSRDGRTSFEQGPALLSRARHVAVQMRSGVLRIFLSRGSDAPERILAAHIRISGDWKGWRPSEPVTVLEPEGPYEGADLPVEKSRFGLADGPVRQLRDPGVFEEDSRTYLCYSVAGEKGIAIAEVIETDADAPISEPPRAETRRADRTPVERPTS